MSCWSAACNHGHCIHHDDTNGNDTWICICDDDWSGTNCDIRWYDTTIGANAYLAYRITFITIWCCLLLFGLHRLWVLSRSRYRKAVATGTAPTPAALAVAAANEKIGNGGNGGNGNNGGNRHKDRATDKIPKGSANPTSPVAAMTAAAATINNHNNHMMMSANGPNNGGNIAPPLPLRIAIGTNHHMHKTSIGGMGMGMGITGAPPAMYTYGGPSSIPTHMIHPQHHHSGHNSNQEHHHVIVRQMTVLSPGTPVISAPLSPTPQPGTGINSSAGGIGHGGGGGGSARNALMSPPMSSPFSPFSPMGSGDRTGFGVSGDGHGAAATALGLTSGHGIPGVVTSHRSSEETLTTPPAHGTPTQHAAHLPLIHHHIGASGGMTSSAVAAAISLPLALAPPIAIGQQTPSHQPINTGRSGITPIGIGGTVTTNNPTVNQYNNYTHNPTAPSHGAHPLSSPPTNGSPLLFAAPPPPPVAPAPPITPSNAQLGMGQVAPSLAHLSSIPQPSPKTINTNNNNNPPLPQNNNNNNAPPAAQATSAQLVTGAAAALVAAGLATTAPNAAAAIVAAKQQQRNNAHHRSQSSHTSHRRTVGVRWRIRQCLSDMQIVSLIVSCVACILLIIAFIDPLAYPQLHHGFIALAFTLVVMVCAFVLRAFTSSMPAGRSHQRQYQQIKGIYIFAIVAFIAELTLSMICLTWDPYWALTSVACVLATHVLVIVVALSIYQSNVLAPLLNGPYAPRATSITAYRQRSSAQFFSLAISYTKLSATVTIVTAVILLIINGGRIEANGHIGMIEQFVFFAETAVVHLCIVIIVGRAPKSRSRHNLPTANAAATAAILAATRQPDYQAPFAGNNSHDQQAIPIGHTPGGGGNNMGNNDRHRHRQGQRNNNVNDAAMALATAQQQQRHARERQQMPPGGGASHDNNLVSPNLPHAAAAYLVTNHTPVNNNNNGNQPVPGNGNMPLHGPPSPNGDVNNSSGDSVRDARAGMGTSMGVTNQIQPIMSPVQHSGFLAPNMARIRGGGAAQSLLVMDSQMASFIDHLGVSEALSRNDGPPRPFVGSSGGAMAHAHGASGGSPMHSSLSPQYAHRPRGYTDSDRRRPPFLPGGGGHHNNNGGYGTGYGGYGSGGAGAGAADNNNTSSVPEGDDEGDTRSVIPPNVPAKSSALTTTATLAAELPQHNVMLGGTLPNGPSASLLSLPPPAAAAASGITTGPVGLPPQHLRQPSFLTSIPNAPTNNDRQQQDDHDDDDDGGHGLTMLTTVAITPIDTMSSPAHGDHIYPATGAVPASVAMYSGSQPPNVGGVTPLPNATGGVTTANVTSGNLMIPPLSSSTDAIASSTTPAAVTPNATTPNDPLSRFGSPVHGMIGSGAGSPFGSGLPSPYHAAFGTHGTSSSGQRSLIGTGTPNTNPATIITLLTGVSSGSNGSGASAATTSGGGSGGSGIMSSDTTAAAISPSAVYEHRATRTLSAASAAAISSADGGSVGAFMLPTIHSTGTGYGGMSPVTHRSSLPDRRLASIGSIGPVGAIGAMMSNGMIVGENSPAGMATGRSIAGSLLSGLYQSQPGTATIDERYVLNMNAIATPSAAAFSNNNSVAVNHVPYTHTLSSIHTYTSSHTTNTGASHPNTGSSPIPLTPSQLAASLPGQIFSPMEPLE